MVKKAKAHKIKKHMESWGIIHLIWSCVAFYAATQYFFKWERPYDEALLGITIAWFLVGFLAREYANHKSKK